LVVISTTAVSHGWWAGPEGPPEVEPLEEQAGWRQHLREWLPGAERRLNATEEWLAGLASWGRELEGASTWGSWDVALWMVVDTLFGMIGWALFGSAWTKVRTGCRRLLQVLVVLGLCLVAHYVWAVCYPIVSLLIGACMAMAWLLRKVLRGVGAFAFWFQRVTGGSPEASEAEFLGPATGRTPETSQLRAFKRSGEQPKHMVVKRGEDAAVFAIGMDSQSIKTHGLYVPVECNTIRGSPALVRRLRDVEKVTHDFWAWLKGSPLTDGTSQLMHRLRELGSESEQEEEHLICCGSLVTWRGPDGTMQCLANRSRTRAVEDIDEGENDDEENGVDNEEAHGDEDRHGRARKLLGRARECEEPEIKERTPRRRGTTRSPGHTPKGSSISRNLSRMGMLESPGSEGAGSLLEEFFEIFAAGKADGLREDQARKKLGADRLLLPGDLLRQLVGEAENEQAQGQRGLSRFLTTWRKELAK
ncbi:Tyr recombinase domain-containing protein, partial [Durusdinium trenchii]